MKLDDRFDALARTRVPDQWHEISEREPQTRSDGEGPSRLRRAGIALLALTVAGAAFTFAARAFDAARRVSGTPAPLAPTLGTIAFTGYRDGLWSLFTVASTGGEPQPISFKQPGNIFHPTWSPDGLRLAFDAQVDEPSEIEGGNRSIFVVDADGSHLTRLTDDAGTWSYLPAWSPDGTKLAYVHNEDGNDDIWVMDADGSDSTRLTSDPAIDLAPAWSPDGARIAFQSNRDGNNEIYVMNADGTGPSRLTDNPAFDARPAWSPTGRLIVFASDRSDSGIYEMNADGTDVQRLTHDPQVGQIDPAWSPDGTRIAYTTGVDSGGPAAIFVLELDTGALTQVTEPGDVCCPSWQPTPSAEPSPLPAQTSSLEPAEPALLSWTATEIPGIAQFPNAIVAGDGGVWAVAPSHDPGLGDIVRLDPSSGNVLSRITVDHLPTWESAGGGLATGGGGVWSLGVDSRDGERHTILDQIDPTTNEVGDEIDIGPGSSGDVWVDGPDIWVVHFTNVPNTLEVVRVALADHRVLARIPIPGEWSQEIFVVGNSVWVSALTAGSDDAFGGPGGEHLLVRVDVATNSFVEQISCACDVSITLSGDLFWAEVEEGLQRFDAATGSPIGDVVPVPSSRDVILSDGAGGVWFIEPTGPVDQLGFQHIDGEGRIIATGRIDGAKDEASWTGIAYAFDPTTNSIWVAHYKDGISRIQLG